MATILNNDPGGARDSSAGWIVAVVVLILAVLFGLFVFPGLMNSEGNTAETETIDRGTDRSGDESPVFNTTVTNSTTTVTTDDDTRATTTTR
ncbi:MAG: hypothetical protein QG636_185 [Patescibacteria group bacterium]|jgi:hypothetical protein|nr:hypothetical protein [Patescibacteria group bacterium]